MSAEATFRYFADPHHFSTYQETPERCELCGEEKPDYKDKGPFYGEQDIEFVCESCLVAGKLADGDITTGEGDAAELERQLRERHPDWSQERITKQTMELTAELEQRTPGITTWQDFFWPAHCGDYCRYIKEVGREYLVRLAPAGDGAAFLAAHLRYTYPVDGQLVWRAMKPDDNSATSSVGVYLFQCLICQDYIIHWDSD